MSRLPLLSDLLKYNNPLVIKRFKRNFPKLENEAESLFTDMLKYLWLCKKYNDDKAQLGDDDRLDFTCVMHREMILIDEMWHTFILITKDYASFCYNYFGEFIHHVPEMGEEVDDDKVELDKELFQNELQRFLSYVYDNLGEQTVRSWFAEYLK